jgi:YHS domain-containing protein
MTKDPVCKMDVDEVQAEAEGLTTEFDNVSYHFCSSKCLSRFQEDPVQYASHIPHHTGPDEEAGAYTN